jgi:hypothetical protein
MFHGGSSKSLWRYSSPDSGWHVRELRTPEVPNGCAVAAKDVEHRHIPLIAVLGLLSAFLAVALGEIEIDSVS